ncbi:MAG TPA: hypothetical protein VEZ11_01730, partial [Thermoanaerobaculia bacterium]|nr:hypothetical protein [Thermoanaerobaculia bacterium]
MALPLRAGDISFDPRITQTDFHTFSLLVAQGIYADPVQPARASGIAGFDLGVAATVVQVDRNATYWLRSVSSDFSTSGYVGVPRIVVSKGFSAGTLSLSYARLSNTGISTVGGALDLPIINGGLARPTLAIRAAYSSLNGVSVYRLRTYGGELFLSKGFGLVVPYIAAGPTRIDARGTIVKTLTNPEI